MSFVDCTELINTQLGNHVSRKHRHLSKIFKPPKPVKMIGDGQVRKRGRPRKYPLPADAKPLNKPNINIAITNTTATNVTAESFPDESFECEGTLTKQLVMVMDLLHEFETSQAEQRFGLFERSPVFSMSFTPPSPPPCPFEME
jgi:hypothetical protein